MSSAVYVLQVTSTTQLDRACGNVVDGVLEDTPQVIIGYQAAAAAPTLAGIVCLL